MAASCVNQLLGSHGAILVASRSEIGWPKSVVASLPVLPALAVPSHPVVVPRSRRPSGKLYETLKSRHHRPPVVPLENSEQPKGRSYSSRRTAKVDGLADPV